MLPKGFTPLSFSLVRLLATALLLSARTSFGQDACEELQVPLMAELEQEYAQTGSRSMVQTEVTAQNPWGLSRGELVRSAEEACAAVQRLGYPVDIKPMDGNHGRGVNIDLRDDEAVRWGFEQAREHSRTATVERFFTEADHRILVIGGEIVAVARRVPARVVGGGTRSISELVNEVNKDPWRGEGHSSVLTPVDLDECVTHFLAHSGLAIQSIPAAGEEIWLRPTANLSTGGAAVDRTDEIHLDTALVAQRAAQIIG